MQIPQKIYLIFVLVLTCLSSLFGQNCKCDSILKSKFDSWNSTVKNSNEIKFIKFIKKGRIKTDRQKKDLVEQITSDSAIVAFPTYDKKFYLKIARYDTISNRKFRIPDYDIDTTKHKPYLAPGDSVQMKVVTFGDKKIIAKEMYKSFSKLNKYYLYSIYLLINNKEYILPSICDEKNEFFFDNFFGNMRVRKE